MTYRGQPARPTTYKGIRMRSRLEATMAAQLDRAGWRWDYEPRAYASEEGQWLPDFEVTGPVVRHFLEVKPTKDAAVAAVDRVRVIFASEPDVTVGIMWPLEDGWGVIAVRSDALMFGDGVRQVGVGWE